MANAIGRLTRGCKRRILAVINFLSKVGSDLGVPGPVRAVSRGAGISLYFSGRLLCGGVMSTETS